MSLPPFHAQFEHETELVSNLEDLLLFLDRARNDDRSWKWAVNALFSAIQSAMILVRGEGAIVTPKNQLQDATSPGDRRVKSFGTLYEELKVAKNWAEGPPIAWTRNLIWDRSVIDVLKLARDDFEHPKYDATVWPCLYLKSGCLDALGYLEYLVSNSPRLRDRLGVHLRRLNEILIVVRQKIEAMPPDPNGA
jgi:hypothetical protein